MKTAIKLKVTIPSKKIPCVKAIIPAVCSYQVTMGGLRSYINSNIKRDKQKPISAGRGGKHYSMGSKYAQFC